MSIQYRNEYVKKWSERAAELRLRLDRVDELHCDGYTTEATPEMEPGIPIEIKATKRFVENGSDAPVRPGRWHLTLSSHDRLVDEDGYYCLIVYSMIEHAGGDRMLIEEMRLPSASSISPLIDTDASVYRLDRTALNGNEGVL